MDTSPMRRVQMLKQSYQWINTLSVNTQLPTAWADGEFTLAKIKTNRWRDLNLPPWPLPPSFARGGRERERDEKPCIHLMMISLSLCFDLQGQLHTFPQFRFLENGESFGICFDFGSLICCDFFMAWDLEIWCQFITSSKEVPEY